jgi:hypothetical protein
MFEKFKNIAFVHDTRKYIDVKGNLIDLSNLRYSHIIRFLESITPQKDVLIDPSNVNIIQYLHLLKYYGAVSTVSLMSVKTECVQDKLKDLKHIHISVETFIPAVASECGLLYHTSRRLTRYRIHESSSITFSSVGEIKVLFNLRRAIEDHEYIIRTVIQKDNNFKYLICMFQLQARYGIASSRYKKIV